MNQIRSGASAAIAAQMSKNSNLRSPLGGSLTPYTGPWGRDQIFHLLRRTTYNLNLEIAEQLEKLGLEGTINLLTADLGLPEEPVNYNFENDPNVPIGSSWVNAPYYNGNGYQNRSMQAWIIGRILSGETHIREKMTLFWHNHFPISDIGDPRFVYRYNTLLRTNILGNFKQLTKEITIDPAMLRYLNGNQNTRNSPNENYARELLELFTIGKGDLAGPGDYTHYTEHDVREIAKILTGWRDRNYRNTTNPDIFVQFRLNVHDLTTKTLSHRFNDAVIENQGELEYQTLMDVIFQQDEVSRFICRKLYRWFVYHHIDETVEATVIEPMAQILRDNDYEIKPALIALLTSEHFFHPETVGCMIKNPMDFVLGFYNMMQIRPGNNINQKYNFWRGASAPLSNLQMSYFNPPSVAGWKAYYQEPLYYRGWLNSVTMPLRKVFTDQTLSNGLGDAADPPDLVRFIEQVPNPYDVNELLDSLTGLFFTKSLSDNQLAVLKDILIPGLPDFEWTVEYGDYQADPSNEDLRKAIQTKLQNLFIYMARMPEFQLS